MLRTGSRSVVVSALDCWLESLGFKSHQSWDFPSATAGLWITLYMQQCRCGETAAHSTFSPNIWIHKIVQLWRNVLTYTTTHKEQLNSKTQALLTHAFLTHTKMRNTILLFLFY